VPADIFDDLRAEYAALDAMLGSLSDGDWASPSVCPGWSVADVVLHLAQTEEGALVSTGNRAPAGQPMFDASRRAMGTIDDIVEEWIEAERGQTSAQRLERWRDASGAVVDALRNAETIG